MDVTKDPNWRAAAYECVSDLVCDVCEQSHADYVLIIAMYVDDRGIMHVVDGGTSPIPVADVYGALSRVHAENDGKRAARQ